MVQGWDGIDESEQRHYIRLGWRDYWTDSLYPICGVKNSDYSKYTTKEPSLVTCESCLYRMERLGIWRRGGYPRQHSPYY